MFNKFHETDNETDAGILKTIFHENCFNQESCLISKPNVQFQNQKRF